MIHKFAVTKAARTVLEGSMPREELRRRVPTITWAEDLNAQSAVGKRILSGALTESEIQAHLSADKSGELRSDGDWSVGYHLRTQVPADKIVRLDGVEFYIDDFWHDRLEGKTLDYVEGHFVVRD